MDIQFLKVSAQNLKVEQHLRSVADGEYRLPEFQRTFVWDNDRVLRLWDSLYHGYPVGQLMLWEPHDHDFPARSFGREQEEAPANAHATAVIDGQQRLTALYLVLTGDIPLRFDLVGERFTYTQGNHCLPLAILRDPASQRVTFEQAISRMLFFTNATSAQKDAFATRISLLNNVLTQRDLPSQTIKNADYATVLGVFKRLNQQGEPLNEAQITLAGISRCWPGVFRRTYDLLLRLNEEMGFDRADDPTFVFQVWTAVHTQQHLVRHLAPEDEGSKYWRLAKRELYEQSWERTVQGVSGLIKLMRDDLDLTNFRFIRAYYPLAVVAHFLATHDQVSNEERDALREWLILSLVGARYHQRAQSKYGADIKATRGSSELGSLFVHHGEALDPLAVESTYITGDSLAKASFRSAYATLLYLTARRLGAVDWLQLDTPVGDPKEKTLWQFHHIFPQDTFDGDRRRLQEDLEDAQSAGDDKAAQEKEREQDALEQWISSIGNLAFLTSETNQRIGNREPKDYLADIAATPSGRRALEAQCIPLDPELWKHGSFASFCQRRCEILAQAARELFFGSKEKRQL